VQTGSGKKKGYLDVVQKLQNNPDLRHEYEELKRSLNGKSKEEYRAAKHQFLREKGIV
jgi:GrpB-like predicted nucleotidyltransferase (UPF0157 family)